MPSLLTTLRNQIPFTTYAFKGEAVACNLCKSPDARTVCNTDRRLKRLRTVVCDRCGLIRTDPMPTDAELEVFYAAEYRLDYQFSVSGRPPGFHLERSRREAEARFAFLQPALSTGCRILDFGSGSGEFLALAARKGHTVRGLEPGESFAAHARDVHGALVDTCTWQRADYPANAFDVITANHVIEHLREPVTALVRLASWLAEDGVLHVSVPNALGRRRHSFQHFHFAHVHSFTPQSLVWAGLVAGLEPDPRFANSGTTIVFSRRKAGPATPDWGVGQGQFVAGHFEPASPLGFLLSGRWLTDAVRRWRKVLRDSRASKQTAARKAGDPQAPTGMRREGP